MSHLCAKIYIGFQLCELPLPRIIRINKVHAEKTTPTVLLFLKTELSKENYCPPAHKKAHIPKYFMVIIICWYIFSGFGTLYFTDIAQLIFMTVVCNTVIPEINAVSY